MDALEKSEQRFLLRPTPLKPEPTSGEIFNDLITAAVDLASIDREAVAPAIGIDNLNLPPPVVPGSVSRQSHDSDRRANDLPLAFDHSL
jgi:hypothetical protein